jgi:RecB family exonuclease
MLEKFAQYVRASEREGRELVAVEQDVEVRVGQAVVRGQVDRLERDAEGRLYVVDLKTGRSQPTRADLSRHAQLGVYQLAVEAGGFEEFASGGPEALRSGGAALVQLGTSTRKPAIQAQRPLADDPEPGWARNLVETVARGMAGSQFVASGNGMCRVCGLRRSCPLQPEGRQVGT